jgi:16S rRNA (cytosine967-C5)-methyltransferase
VIPSAKLKLKTTNLKFVDMAGQKLKSARSIAAEVLNRCDPKRNYAGTILDGLRHETDQSQRATDLVFGTLRNRRAIDTVIATFSSRPVKRIQGWLLNIIRVGTYELIYSPSTEQYAIVNEAVMNVKASGSAKQAGFVNAVLRQITRHINDRQWAWPSCGVPLLRADVKRTLVADAVTGCQFDTEFLPEARTNPIEYLSTVFSLPKWLVIDWIAEFDEEITRRICLASNRRPSVYIRPNRLRTTIEDLAEKMDAAEVDFEVVDIRYSIPDTRYKILDARRESRIENQESRMILHGMPYGRVKCPRDVIQLPGFSEGLFTIQDISASIPVRVLKNLKLKNLNLKFLDLCAAPGTKTTQLAEVTGDSAKIIATDINNKRLEMVKENIARLGINSVDVVPYEELLNSQSRFDCVLLDVPCSNSGVLARRIEARYRINPQAVKELAQIQSKLLGTAAEMLKPGGKICYSTCSIQKNENSEQIENFLKINQNFSLELERLTLPSTEDFDHDGGYVAIVVKDKNKI